MRRIHILCPNTWESVWIDLIWVGGGSRRAQIPFHTLEHGKSSPHSRVNDASYNIILVPCIASHRSWQLSRLSHDSIVASMPGTSVDDIVISLITKFTMLLFQSHIKSTYLHQNHSGHSKSKCIIYINLNLDHQIPYKFKWVFINVYPIKIFSIMTYSFRKKNHRISLACCVHSNAIFHEILFIEIY